MSMKRLAVMSAVGSHSFNNNNSSITYFSEKGGHHQGLQTMRPSANLHGNVNIMLGGAMLSVVITVVCFVCYCCHRNIKKRSASSTYRQRWLENDPNMEIYSVEQCYDTSALFMDPQENLPPPPGHGPPPSYEQVVAYDEIARQQQIYKNAHINHNHQGNYCPFTNSTNTTGSSAPTTIINNNININNTITSTPLITAAGTILPNNLNLSLKCDSTDVFSDAISEEEILNNIKDDDDIDIDLDDIDINININSDNINNNSNQYYLENNYSGRENLCRLCGKYYFNNFIQHNSFNDKCHCTNLYNNNNSLENNNSNSLNNNNNNNEIETTILANLNENLPSTSNTLNIQTSYALVDNLTNNNHNNNNTCNEININNNNNTSNDETIKIDFDNINENGILRLDMSQIIDNTGLPTYEAALKLESSGYV